MNFRIALLGLAAFILAGLVAIKIVPGGLSRSSQGHPPQAAPAVTTAPPFPAGKVTAPDAGARGRPHVGVAAVRVGDLSAYQQLTGVKPSIVEFYQRVGVPFPAAKASQIVGFGALPFVQLSPRHITLAAIASGRYDSYFRKYAEDIKQFKYSVALSFAPEANGTWYTWGCHHSAAPTFVAAWRHVHDVMTQAGARNITWMWVVNVIYKRSCPLAERWPGSAYVDWVGFDGQFRGRRTTYDLTFKATVAQAHKITNKPMVISETGVLNGPLAASEVRSLFKGVEQDPQIIGVVYFNYFDNRGSYRLQSDPAELATFRQSAKDYLSFRPQG